MGCSLFSSFIPSGWVISLSIDYWQIYERSIARMEGLARLFVLEKLTDTDIRYDFLEIFADVRTLLTVTTSEGCESSMVN